MKTVVFTNY